MDRQVKCTYTTAPSRPTTAPSHPSTPSSRPSTAPRAPSVGAGEPGEPTFLALQRRRLVERVVRALGVWGRALEAGAPYPGHRVRVEQGAPAAMWLSANTSGRTRLQRLLQDSLRGAAPLAGAVGAGALVVARYSGDHLLYRARVVAARGDALTVHYLDYGNTEEVGAGALYPWDPALALVPAQATLCRLRGLVEGATLTEEEVAVFEEMVAGSAPYRLQVHRRLLPPGGEFRPGGGLGAVELEVALHTRGGEDLVEVLRRHTLLARFFPATRPDVSSTPLPPLPPLLPPLEPPHPAHLALEGSSLTPTTPIPSRVVTGAISKVAEWMERGCGEAAETPVEDFDEPHRNEGEEVKERDQGEDDQEREVDEKLLHSEVEVRQEEVDGRVEQVKDRLGRQKEVNEVKASLEKVEEKSEEHEMEVEMVQVDVKEGLESTGVEVGLEPEEVVLEQEGFKLELVPEQQDEEVVLEQQEVMLDSSREFRWLLGHLEGPGEVWVQPVQAATRRLLHLEQVLEEVGVGVVASVEECRQGTCWALHTPSLPAWRGAPAWLRVRVEEEGEEATVRSVDYGPSLVVAPSSLHHLPPGLPTTLPGLAVLCSLHPLAPGGWAPGAGEAARALLDMETVYTARVPPGPPTSPLPIVVELQAEAGELHSTILNELLQEEAATPWDPMTSDYTTITNNYLTNDTDPAVAALGYRSREGGLCHFYLNSGGRCYKGAYCQDRHLLPRHGAVTADQEEVLLASTSPLRLSTCLARAILGHVISPSRFYLTFPNGAKPVSGLSAGEARRARSPRSDNFQRSLAAAYQQCPKRLVLSCLPAPGSLVAARLAGAWHRAAVMEEGGEGDASQQVLLVDMGQVATVRVTDLR